MSTGMLALAFERPWALALLALPLVLLVLALRRRQQRVVATSDLDVWRASEQRGAASRPRVPPRAALALVLALLALASGALAVAGPRNYAERMQWTCVLDTSASMSLADGGTTRRARAIESARALAARHDADVRWVDAATGREMHGVDAASSDELDASSTSFAAWDSPATVWVTDVIPAERPRYAGFVASGGAAVPGPVAVESADRIDWDGSALTRVVDAAPSRSVAITGLDVASTQTPLARVLRAWAEARGVRVAKDAGEPDVALAVLVDESEPKREMEAGRDGWTAKGRSSGDVNRGYGARDLVPWLTGAGETLVGSNAGFVAITWIPGTPSDPAAFAVSWARLFDDALLAPRGVVPLDERVAAGAPGHSVPVEADRTSSTAFGWIAAALAALLALGALLARRA